MLRRHQGEQKLGKSSSLFTHPHSSQVQDSRDNRCLHKPKTPWNTPSRTNGSNKKKPRLKLLTSFFAFYFDSRWINRLLKGCRVKAETGLSVAGEQDCPGGKENRAITLPSNGTGRYSKNNIYLTTFYGWLPLHKQEFALLQGDANIYKLIGPVLVKQDKTEAVTNVDKRIDFIQAEM